MIIPGYTCKLSGCNGLRLYMLVFAVLIFSAVSASAQEAVGVIAAVRGEVELYRGKDTLKPARNEKVYLGDVIVTGDSGRVKMNFIDDSAITVFEFSNFSIQEYVYDAAKKKGSSVFKIAEGKLKALVGRAEFEIHTPTAVAAARGTYFFVEMIRDAAGKLLTKIYLLEGGLLVKNSDPGVRGVVSLTAGQSTSVTQDTAPVIPMGIDESQMKDLLSCRIVNEGEKE